ncbi:MAG: amidoligase family protein [Selenomonadaceae bacterium]|nr:amidoligase family protein [Selenomonadaceae bacterium]MBR1806232.1 amidoligase family protein [Selenomonadaceae bacterium]
MKTQTIGTEIEFTGITREKAANVIAKFFGTHAQYEGSNYKKYTAKDNSGRTWTVMRDSSIRIENDGERCELVTPILRWDDIETLQEIVRQLRRAGAKVNETCGLHVHIGANGMTAQNIRTLVNLVASRENIFYNALKVHEERKEYCQPTNQRFLRELNQKKPATLGKLKTLWYGDSREHTWHYDTSRYTILNLHAFFTKGTVEFRIFNSTLHAGEVKAAIQFCAAMVAFAKKARRTVYHKIETDNEKFAMRTFLTRLGLNGDEFKTARLHLTKNLSGNAAWRFAV